MHTKRVGIAVVVLLSAVHPVRGEEEFSAIVEQARQAVVRIETAGPKRSVGAGFLVDKSGLVATNYHLLAGAQECTVEFVDKRRYRVAQVEAVEHSADLAVLRIPEQDVEALMLATGPPQQGDEVYTFGVPSALGFRVSRGVVSAVTAVNEDRDGQSKAGEGPSTNDPTRIELVQSDAPIFSGNSGGPLLSSRGEVLGVNSWQITQGQNLSCASATANLRRLLEAAQSATPIAGLPKPQPSAASSKVSQPAATSVTLPGGKLLDLAIFKHQPGQLAEAAGTDTSNVLTINYASGKEAVRVQRQADVLHGESVSYYETGKPMLVANYLNGQRQGNFLAYRADDGGLAFVAQYRKQKRHGFVVLFADGSPWLIQEFEGDRPVAFHLCEQMSVHKTFQPQEDDPILHEAVAQLEELGKTLTEHEKKVKRFVRSVDLDERQQRAAENSVAARANSAKRRAQRQAANNAVVNGLLQRSMRGR